MIITVDLTIDDIEKILLQKIETMGYKVGESYSFHSSYTTHRGMTEIKSVGITAYLPDKEVQDD